MGIRKEWISDSTSSQQKASDGQSISPYACNIASFHPKVCFRNAGQGVNVSRQALTLCSGYNSIDRLIEKSMKSI